MRSPTLSLLVGACSILAETASGSAVSRQSLRCSSNHFTFPTILGADLLSITANEAYDYTQLSLAPGSSEILPYTIDFCNVTVIYTHPGWNDTVSVSAWLPLSDWNNRLWALGGGGYSASLGPLQLTQAVAKSYAAIATDAGHTDALADVTNPAWALANPGNLNLYLLENFASRSLHELTIIGKHITAQYYDVGPEYSYFAGCSGGGRQALEIAQRFPNAYDGILAVAPAINIDTFVPAAYWAQHVMYQLDYFPPPCAVEAFTQAAIQACDDLDGVRDGIISAPERCGFDASSVVGEAFSCNGTTRHLTEKGARVVQAAWDGPHRAGIGWPGPNKDAPISAQYAGTQCDSNGTCTPSNMANLISGFLKYFLAKDPAYDTTTMTSDDFFHYLKQSYRDFHQLLGSADPDLSDLKASGTKLLMWQGLADEAIPPAGNIAYYKQVLSLDPNTTGYYRFFLAPGVKHCFGGPGPMPNGAFDQLRSWVENGTVPEVLEAKFPDGRARPLCPLPAKQIYTGGDPHLVSSWTCDASGAAELLVVNGEE